MNFTQIEKFYTKTLLIKERNKKQKELEQIEAQNIKKQIETQAELEQIKKILEKMER